MKSSKSVCEESNFNQLVSNLGRNLRNYLIYLCGSKEAAEDIAQETFINLWENCEKVEYDTAQYYVFHVARRSFLKIKRHEKVVLKYNDRNKPQDNHQSPEFLMQEKQFKEQLLEAIQNLSEAQRTAFLMNRIDNMTYREIAEALGISVKAVEKRIHNALKNLYEKVDEIKSLKI